MGFEAAPFKLTQEYLDILGGPESTMFLYFKSLLIRGFVEVRKHMDELIVMIQIMATKQVIKNASTGQTHSSMPCFRDLSTLEHEIRQRISCKNNLGNNKTNEF